MRKRNFVNFQLTVGFEWIEYTVACQVCNMIWTEGL